MSPRVAIAHEEPSIRAPALEVSRGLGFETVGVADGRSVVTLLRWSPPDVLVTDVGLPDLLGYELCEQIEALGLATKVIFIASVYSKTAYKRRPTSLYGAFDYIEQHHVVDELGDKLVAALGNPGHGSRDAGENTINRERADIEDAGLRRLKFGATGLEPIENAQRLARLLVADVLLYAGEAGQTWLEAGADSADLPLQLQGDLAEARRLFNAEVPFSVRGPRDFVAEAIRRMVASRV